MREIKFRGKDINGNWHYGLLTHDETPSFKSDYEWFISNSKGKPYAYGVIEETIGQFTGLHDKNGVEIYEGDIVQERGLRKTWTLSRRDEFSERKHVIMWDEEQLEWIGNILEEYLMKIWDRRDLGFLNEKYTLEVIGNIHKEVGE